MTNEPTPKPKTPAPDYSEIPEFAKAIRGLAHVPKKEVDDAIAKDKSQKMNIKPYPSNS
jgi:hypothetical protein